VIYGIFVMALIYAKLAQRSPPRSEATSAKAIWNLYRKAITWQKKRIMLRVRGLEIKRLFDDMSEEDFARLTGNIALSATQRGFSNSFSNSFSKSIYMARILFFVLILFSNISFSQKRPEAGEPRILLKETMRVQFIPEREEREVDAGLLVAIQPLDARMIDRIVEDAIVFDGAYKKTKVTLVGESLPKVTGRPSRELNVSRKKAIVSFLRERIVSGALPEEAGEELMKIVWDKTIGLEIFNIDQSTDAQAYSEVNPYKVGGRYLSVFQVSLENRGEEPQVVLLRDLLFNSGNEQLFPRDIAYFEKLYEQDQQKLDLCYRLNFPDELLIPPGGKVVKYLATSSLNPANETLGASLLRGGKTVAFDFRVELDKKVDKKYYDEYLFIRNRELDHNVRQYYFVATTDNGHVFPIKENRLYWPREWDAAGVSIYGVYVLSDGFYFGKRESFTLNKANCPVNNIAFIPFFEFGRFD
jgi:hypothetical protein